jgi:hypothetical protein
MYISLFFMGQRKLNRWEKLCTVCSPSTERLREKLIKGQSHAALFSRVSPALRNQDFSPVWFVLFVL